MDEFSRAAAVMYPDLAKAEAPAIVNPEAGTAAEPARDAPIEASDEAEAESFAERLYPEDGTPPEGGDYGPLVNDAFDTLERQERQAPELSEENLVALREGRQQVQATLQEFGVGAPGAKELSGTFARYRELPMSDEALAVANVRCVQELQEAWGSKYAQNLAFAKAAYQEASKRIPWLAAEGENGAGSDPRVIKQFAAIGRRLAKRASA